MVYVIEALLSSRLILRNLLRCVLVAFLAVLTHISDGTGESFAKFSKVFVKFSQDFRGFRSFWDVLGPVRTCSDAFGHVRIRLETFRRF